MNKLAALALRIENKAFTAVGLLLPPAAQRTPLEHVIADELAQIESSARNVALLLEQANRPDVSGLLPTGDEPGPETLETAYAALDDARIENYGDHTPWGRRYAELLRQAQHAVERCERWAAVRQGIQTNRDEAEQSQ